MATEVCNACNVLSSRGFKFCPHCGFRKESRIPVKWVDWEFIPPLQLSPSSKTIRLDA